MPCRKKALRPLRSVYNHEVLPVLYRLPILYQYLDHAPRYGRFHLVDDVKRLDGCDKLSRLDTVSNSNQGASSWLSPYMEETYQVRGNYMLRLSLGRSGCKRLRFRERNTRWGSSWLSIAFSRSRFAQYQTRSRAGLFQFQFENVTAVEQAYKTIKLLNTDHGGSLVLLGGWGLPLML